MTALTNIEDYLSLTAYEMEQVHGIDYIADKLKKEANKMTDNVEITDDEIIVIFNFKDVDEEYRKYVLYDFLQRLYADMEEVLTFE